ncbi:MAG: DUF1326 domain-containing protein [Gemmatimonadetes bacterium]|nr:DUF1326 domain-containing protein [Gemmatimonadota bacterium]MYI06560.1 DUF1326 domain-containing protein [Gemmatimonadota bacterium]
MSDWWAEGLLFENCNCTAVCPGHIHFSQKCTHEVCHGFWAIRFDGGRAEEVDLAGVDVVVVYETPQVMVDGGWKQVIIVSDRATAAQRQAVEEILTGARGGPWEILARFVGDARPTRTAPIRIEEAPGRKSVTVKGVLKGAVEAIRGRTRAEPVTFENIYNQIHDTTQVIARGSTRYDDGEIVIANDGTHGLWSHFRWE